MAAYRTVLCQVLDAIQQFVAFKAEHTSTLLDGVSDNVLTDLG